VGSAVAAARRWRRSKRFRQRIRAFDSLKAKKLSLPRLARRLKGAERGDGGAREGLAVKARGATGGTTGGESGGGKVRAGGREETTLCTGQG